MRSGVQRPYRLEASSRSGDRRRAQPLSARRSARAWMTHGHDRAVGVAHERVAHVAELGFHPGALATDPPSGSIVLACANQIKDVSRPRKLASDCAGGVNSSGEVWLLDKRAEKFAALTL